MRERDMDYNLTNLMIIKIYISENYDPCCEVKA
jgi:hypothetical protein